MDALESSRRLGFAKWGGGIQVHLNSDIAGEVESILHPDPRLEFSFDLVEIIEETRSELLERSPEASINVESPDSLVLQSNVSIKAAVREAMVNAVKHTDASAPRIRVTVDEHPRDAEVVVISVADEGPGIPEAERIALHGEEETSIEHTSGIGLWVIKWVITAAGGTVELLDNEPWGSVVIMTLPSS